MIAWPPGLIAQFPLPPDMYEWHGGDDDSYAYVEIHADRGWDTRWVFDTSDMLVVTYPPYSGVRLRTYPVSSPEEAIALIYNLVLFGETS